MSFAWDLVQLGSSYKLNGTDLRGFDSMRDLGVIVDSEMSFGNQIESVVN